jgi:hypothetical protein
MKLSSVRKLTGGLTPLFALSIAGFVQSQGGIAWADDVSGNHVDCTETPVTIDQLNTLAQSKDVNSMVDFLRAIPDGAMQSFTFVYNSRSIQKGNQPPAGSPSPTWVAGEVSPMWPRTLRSTIDGKITISFVCDPQNPAYGAVEAFYFDDATNTLRTFEWNFGNKSAPTKPSERSHPDSTTCFACHSGGTINKKTSLKFNWPEYFFWGDCQRDRGITVYGSNDDALNIGFRARMASSPGKIPQGCDEDKDRQMHMDEVADYQKFREKQKDDVCFNTLPWPKVQSQSVVAYPYQYQDAQFSLKPNIRFTDVYSRWTGRRIVQLLKANSQYYDFLKYYVALEGAGCGYDLARVSQLLGDSIKEEPVSGIQHLYDHPAQSHPFLYAYGKQVGLQDRDWTLEFHVDDDPSYNGGNDEVSDFVSGEILKEIGEENPEIKALSNFRNSVSDPKFSCLNEIADTIKTGGPNYPGLCQALQAEADKSFAALTVSSNKKKKKPRSQPTPVETPSAAQHQSFSSALLSAANSQMGTAHSSHPQTQMDVYTPSSAHGHVLMQANSTGKCVTCHSTGADSELSSHFRFFPSDQDSDEQNSTAMSVLKSKLDDGFLKTVNEKLIQDKSMPPFDSTLSDHDRLDIQAYIESLAK